MCPCTFYFNTHTHRLFPCTETTTELLEGCQGSIVFKGFQHLEHRNDFKERTLQFSLIALLIDFTLSFSLSWVAGFGIQKQFSMNQNSRNSQT
jgi:hypothetical protein